VAKEEHTRTCFGKRILGEDEINASFIYLLEASGEKAKNNECDEI